MQYCELHLHTHYSLLDGLNTPEEYMARAKELGMTHLAQTDHGTLSGHRDFQRAAKEAGIVPILGVEAYYSTTGRFDVRPVKKRDDNTKLYHHIGLLSLNENGLRNLNRISEIAWTEGFYMKPRIDFEVLAAHSDDIVMLSGCLGSPIIKEMETDYDSAVQMARSFRNLFGERFFIEIQGHNPPEINAGLLQIAQDLSIRPVVTSDCHHARQEDAWIEDALLVISTNPDRAKGMYYDKVESKKPFDILNALYPDRTMTFEKLGLWLRSAEEQEKLLANQGIGTEPIENTMIVAGMVGDYPFHEALSLLPSPPTESPDELLRRRTMAGLKNLGKDSKEYITRANEELDVIISMGYSSYIIIVANMVKWARSKGIMVGPGRGSAVGSLICYAMGITQVDPIERNLLFFRFIDPSRGDYPDIDIDIEDSRRGEVKAYMARQYSNAASIITFGKFKGKSAIKAAGRAFGLPYAEVNSIVKNAEYPDEEDFFDAWLVTDSGRKFKKDYPVAVELARYLEGRINQTGVHAGGVVVSKEPISRYAPMQTGVDPNDKAAPRIPIVALDMNDAAEIGLIKQDILGLKALSVIRETLEMIESRHGEKIDLLGINLEDGAVYDDISAGNTKAIFQIEAGPYTKLIRQMGGVYNFEDLVTSNALVRPGASDSSIAKRYLHAKKTGQPRYIHPDVKYFTESTYGEIIFQEQQMLLCTELAGMTMQEANGVRHAIGKKKAEELAGWEERFMGAADKIGTRKAQAVWKDLQAAARYSFNRSHAVAYSTITYWMAWLKHYYPLEFMFATLRNEKEKDAKVGYFAETRQLGIRVVLPHVSTSDISTCIKDDYIQMGLSDIKFISEIRAKRLIERRPFASYADLRDKVTAHKSGLGSPVLKALDAVGAAAFADHPLTGNERDNFYEYLNIPAFSQTQLPHYVASQFTPMADYKESAAAVLDGVVKKIQTGPGWALVHMIDESGEAAAFAEPNTPIQVGERYIFLVAEKSIIRYTTIDDLLASDGVFREYLYARSFPDVPPGMFKVIAFKSRTTKNGNKMATAVVSDEYKQLTPVIVFPRQFIRAYSNFTPGAVLDLQFRYKDGTTILENIL